MITPVDHLGAVTRSLSTTQRDGVEVKRLTATLTYPTDVADLWDALTTSARIPRWFMPISGDLRIGGRFQLEGNAAGEILTCEPPTHLGITWEYGGDVSWVDLTVSGDENSATVELVHLAPVPPQLWDQFGPGAVGIGWEMGLMGLAEHLSVHDSAVDPATAAAWMTSADGLTFITGASKAWGEASIAAGEDPEQARAAAARCTAAYTATEEPAQG